MNEKQGSLKAVVFDVDGKLIDSVDVHAQAWVDALAELGHEVRFGDVRRQIGKGGDQLMPVFLSKAEIDRFGEKLQERRGALLKERYIHRIQPFPAVRELFQRVIADGKAIALASSAKEDELEQYKKIANIVDLIDVETSPDDAEKSKPHPDIFQAVLARLDIAQPEQVVVIGDTPDDAEAAAKAGLRTIGLLCGGWSEYELKRAGCVASSGIPPTCWRATRNHRWRSDEALIGSNEFDPGAVRFMTGSARPAPPRTIPLSNGRSAGWRQKWNPIYTHRPAFHASKFP